MIKRPSRRAATRCRLPAVLPLVLAVLSTTAVGQTVPNAGSILQQVQPVAPPAPSNRDNGLTIEREGSAPLPPSTPFAVRTLRITGNTSFDTAILQTLVADAEGKSLTLVQLGEAVARITDYYQSHGYPLARAIIPAQAVRDGVVQVQVIEARYGKVNLDNRSQTSGSLLQATLAPLQSGQVISQAPMDRALLLLSDVPGVSVSATLKPGEAIGTADLLVDAAPGPALTANAVFDDYGSRYTGRPRLGGTLTLIGPLHHGDVLSASVVSSGRGMSYGRLLYETLLNGRGTRLGGSYSALHYSLGGPLASLNAHGTAALASLWLKHPLLRSASLSLYGQIQYDQTQLRDHIDASSLKTDRHVRAWSASLAGDARDTLLSGGINTWSLRWTNGRVGFDDASAQQADAATAKTEGGYSKWTLSAARLQRLGPRDGLYLSYLGQWASTNLDASQKLIAGGPYSVRAYDVGAISGDTGYLGSAEWRHELGSAWRGQWQFVAFADSAHITVNRNAWVSGANSATLSGAGIGLNWTGPERWSARLYVATPVGSTPALVGSTTSARGWVEVSRAF